MQSKYEILLDLPEGKGKDWKWNSLSIKERTALLEQWEKDDAYPYGRSNAKKRFDAICGHYLQNRIIGLEG